MQAKETNFLEIIEGTKQYVVPLFQRQYSWEKKQWNVLWRDIIELCELEKPRKHFFGSIVNLPTDSVPEGVTKFLVIDGQQRLTTIFIILMVLRDQAVGRGEQNLAKEIDDTLLLNPFKDRDDRFKLMPTQDDRDVYKQMIESKGAEGDDKMSMAYQFFKKKLSAAKIEPRNIVDVITRYFSVVSIVLDREDDPYMVFESLNAKGLPLTAADLIRNYFFMRIHVDEQDKYHSELWKPMQDALGDNLTEFIRHFLMREGTSVKEPDVYFTLKDQVTTGSAIDYLHKLKAYSEYYARFIDPEREPDEQLRKYFLRFKEIVVRPVYPLLLLLYAKYSSNTLSPYDFGEILKTLDNYLIRRFVCGKPTHTLTKTFLSLCSQISKSEESPLNLLKAGLQGKEWYPQNDEFLEALKRNKIYNRGTPQVRLILESLEEELTPKERVSFDELTIEHVMPQTITPEWKAELGEQCEEAYDTWLHTIGNLTLTAYNAELSNDDFAQKKEVYSKSNVALNHYFSNIEHWGSLEIEQRAEWLGQLALKVWPYFGDLRSKSNTDTGVTGKKPISMTIFGQRFEVHHWRAVWLNTLNAIIDMVPEKFDVYCRNHPHRAGKDKTQFHAAAELSQGYFTEANFRPNSIKDFCNSVLEETGFSRGDLKIEYV